MFWLYQSTLILASCVFSVMTFDMWKIIETENEFKVPEKKGNFSTQFDSIRPKLFNGDILRDVSKPQNSPDEMQAPFTWHQSLWVNREIPYEITSSLTDSTATILASLKKISDVTCLSFPEKKSTDNNWIQFFRGQGCYSGIGRKYWSQKETGISLGQNCVHPSIIVHEVLHAAGFYHEQSRFDRDSYVKIYTDRVIPSMLDNFDKTSEVDSNTMKTGYDLKSIMHYSQRSFAKAPDGKNTIENKFDPNFELGNTELSNTDIKEINALYQCHIKSGWSEWSDWSDCVLDWRKQCTKAIVRFCVSKDISKCPGVNSYGTQDIVKVCGIQECKEQKIDGIWGAWGSYSACSGSCGWGKQVRYRECNNPTPMFGGKNCSGSNQEYFLCRNTRCNGASPFDLNFEDKNFRKWQFSGFAINRNENSLTEGPSRDVTSVNQGKPYGYYAVATGSDNSQQFFIKSPIVTSFKGEKCLSFFFMLNGAKLHMTEALSVYIIENSKQEIIFVTGGHQGNYWNRVSINIKNRMQQFQIMIQAKHMYGTSSVAIDDIFFDDNACPAGLSGCKDLSDKCPSLVLNGQCEKNWRAMLAECCASCSNANLI
ncbi:uncharacterized protein LOC100201110 isoform X1 [Hydra vulgaris]|uniref:uncharacterized protein LOC100201110 isoform X1 n=1 Tax=Hydra vulgaris TaxID=6087 RepID=UPI0006414545|nr:uncharacterized protein LOC100201110 isoform X2 [Hydra vulgaris]